jgi:hypothetical protein
MKNEKTRKLLGRENNIPTQHERLATAPAVSHRLPTTATAAVRFRMGFLADNVALGKAS